MSEHQSYEFLAVDRPLTADEQGELRDLSTRATITPWSFSNTYNWGSLKTNPEKMLARWFDAYLYISNYGSYQLSLRIPKGRVRAKDLEPYVDTTLAYEEIGEHLCIHLRIENDSGWDWFDHEGMLSRMLPLREALMSGDHRCLYLAWLFDVQTGSVDSSEDEAPVPPGLAQSDAALDTLAELLHLSEDLLSAAREGSAPLEIVGPERAEVLAWLSTRKPAERDEWLLRVFTGEGARVSSELRSLYREGQAKPSKKATARRTVGDLLDRSEAIEEARLDAERAEKERAAKERAAARQRYLDSLVSREEELWKQVATLVAEMKPASYDRAVVLLTDLRDLAVREDTREAFDERLIALRKANKTKSSFLRRAAYLDA